MNLGRALPAIVMFGIGLLGLFLASCSSLQRTMMAPPRIEGATFVGNKSCIECHADYTRHFPSSPHARLQLEGAPREDHAGCESCHGPASLHVKAGGGKG